MFSPICVLDPPEKENSLINEFIKCKDSSFCNFFPNFEHFFLKSKERKDKNFMNVLGFEQSLNVAQNFVSFVRLHGIGRNNFFNPNFLLESAKCGEEFVFDVFFHCKEWLCVVLDQPILQKVTKLLFFIF